MTENFHAISSASPDAANRLRRAVRSGALEIVQAGLEPILRAQEALARRDWAELARLLHSLRGAAGNFDSGQFAAAARDVESAIKTHAFELIPARLDAAAQHYGNLLDVTAHWLQDEQDNVAIGDEGAQIPLSAPALQYLVHLLESQSFNAIDEFGRLRGALAEHAAIATSIDRQLDRLDFKAAAEQVRALATTLGLALTR